jgi:glycosyltransferase involved in cell wall biosynthesis
MFFLLAVLQNYWGKKMVIVHNGDLLLPAGRVNRILEKVFDGVGAVSASMSDALIAYSDDYAAHSRFFAGFLNKTIAIFPLFPRLAVDKKQTQLFSKRLGEKTGPFIGFAGRFVEEKGFDILLAAIPWVKKKFPTATFLFAGEVHMGYEQFFEKNKMLWDRMADNVISFGKLSQQEMQSWYQLLDVFVLPSRSDCLAFVQVEAMLQGVPVVVTDIPGARVVVKKTGMGRVVAKEDPEALAHGIISVLLKKKEYMKKKELVEKMFDNEENYKKFEMVIGKRRE